MLEDLLVYIMNHNLLFRIQYFGVHDLRNLPVIVSHFRLVLKFGIFSYLLHPCVVFFRLFVWHCTTAIMLLGFVLLRLLSCTCYIFVFGLDLITLLFMPIVWFSLDCCAPRRVLAYMPVSVFLFICFCLCCVLIFIDSSTWL